MTAPALFGALVRTIGLLVVLYSGLQLLMALVIVMSVGSDVLPIRSPLVMGIVGLLIGLYLLRGARLVRRFAYGQTE